MWLFRLVDRMCFATMFSAAITLVTPPPVTDSGLVSRDLRFRHLHEAHELESRQSTQQTIRCMIRDSQRQAWVLL